MKRFLLLMCGILATTTSPALALETPNVIILLTDDVRFDDLGCAGHPFSKTPNVDRIPREGITFQNAFATTPLSSPTRASFLTGLYPHTHGIIDNTDRSPPNQRLATLPHAPRK